MSGSPARVLAFFFALLEDTPAGDVEGIAAAAEVEEAVGGAGSGMDEGADLSSSSSSSGLGC